MRHDTNRSRFRKVSAPWLGFSCALLAWALLPGCGGGQSAPAPAPVSASPAAPASAAPAAAGAEEGGAGPQILTADLLKRQEVRADKLIANWAIIGASEIRTITINGRGETFAPGDTVSIQKEFILKIAQTVITIAAVDAKGDKREVTYLIVNPGLPFREPEPVAVAPTKIAENKEEQKKQEAEIAKIEAEIRAQYSEGEYSPWYYTGPLNQVYNREVRRGSYPVWMDARFSGQPQYRMVFKPLPPDVLTHRAYWGLTPSQYNDLVDDLTARGYQQVFREVLLSNSEQWRIQCVWVLKVPKRK